jgi:hypothetical protein
LQIFRPCIVPKVMGKRYDPAYENSIGSDEHKLITASDFSQYLQNGVGQYAVLMNHCKAEQDAAKTVARKRNKAAVTVQRFLKGCVGRSIVSIMRLAKEREEVRCGSRPRRVTANGARCWHDRGSDSAGVSTV